MRLAAESRSQCAGGLLQGATIPSGASPVDLAFWWLAESGSEQPGDAVHVVIPYGEEQGDLLLTLQAEDPWASGDRRCPT